MHRAIVPAVLVSAPLLADVRVLEAHPSHLRDDEIADEREQQQTEDAAHFSDPSPSNRGGNFPSL